LADLRSETLAVETPGGDVLHIGLRVSARARRISLRIDPTGGGAVLVMPEGVALRHGERFAREQAGWLARQLADQPARIPFEDGVRFDVMGVGHRIIHRPDQRRGVWTEEAGAETILYVSGEADHLSRRTTDWLKRRAREEIAPRVRTHAAALDRRFTKLSIRDTTSRWGSCSSRGTLSFSWRLILAPEEVLDYVCAHETAHLVEMNHSPAFWRLVEGLVGDWRTPRSWLRRHGAELHRFG